MSDQSAEEAAIDRFVTKLKQENAALRAQLDTSMRRQETLAKNVNDGLLEAMALRAELDKWHKLAEQHNDTAGRLSYDRAGAYVENDKLKAENERLKGETDIHRDDSLAGIANITITDLQAQVTALQQELVDAVAQGEWEKHKHTTTQEQLRLCNIDQCNAEAQVTALEEQLGDAHGACCEAGIEEQYESSGDLCYYTVAARIRLLAAQVTAQERDFGIQREYWNECEHKLAAMTQERDDLQARVKELEKVFEYRRST